MRGLLIAAVLVMGMVLLGWLSFANSDDSTTISIDKDKMKQDTQEAVEKTERAIDKAAEKTREAIDGVREEVRENVREDEEVEAEIDLNADAEVDPVQPTTP